MTQTEGTDRTAKARAANKRKAQDRRAEKLKAEGWRIAPPICGSDEFLLHIDYLMQEQKHTCQQGTVIGIGCSRCLAELVWNKLEKMGYVTSPEPGGHRLDCTCSNPSFGQVKLPVFYSEGPAFAYA